MSAPAKNPTTSQVSAEEIEHIHHHVQMYWKFIGFFFLISLIAVLFSPYVVDLSHQGNLDVAYGLLAARCILICIFFAQLFGEFIVISRFFFMTIIFLIFMIGLCIWAFKDPISNVNDHSTAPPKTSALIKPQP